MPIHGSHQLADNPTKAGQPGCASWSYIALSYAPHVCSNTTRLLMLQWMYNWLWELYELYALASRKLSFLFLQAKWHCAVAFSLLKATLLHLIKMNYSSFCVPYSTFAKVTTQMVLLETPFHFLKTLAENIIHWTMPCLLDSALVKHFSQEFKLYLLQWIGIFPYSKGYSPIFAFIVMKRKAKFNIPSQ